MASVGLVALSNIPGEQCVILLDILVLRERQRDCPKHWREFQRHIEKAVRFWSDRDHRNQITPFTGIGGPPKSGRRDAKRRLMWSVETSFRPVCVCHTKPNEAHATEMTVLGSIVHSVSARPPAGTPICWEQNEEWWAWGGKPSRGIPGPSCRSPRWCRGAPGRGVGLNGPPDSEVYTFAGTYVNYTGTTPSPHTPTPTQ